MNNQNFPHFEWGTHENPAQDFYGLADLMTRRIYLVHHDYQLLKLLQFIILSSKHLILFPFNGIKNYTPGIIDNSVCLAWQFNSTAPFNNLSTGFTGTYKDSFPVKLKTHTIPPSNKDFDIQQNLFLISKLVTFTDIFIKNQCKMQIDLDHHIELANFCKIVLPNDCSILSMIDVDQNSVTDLKNKIESCRGIIIKILANLNYTQEYKQIVADIKTHTELLPVSTELETRFKNYLMNILL